MAMEHINWIEWSQEAFEKAKKENKLVLLDIYGTWCHWCHVADKTTYADKDIIKLVNEKFVAVKVDTDKRPDINDRYNLGGWPTTAILTPEAELVVGGTYIPPTALFDLLVRIRNFYGNDREKFERKLKENRRKTRMLAPEKTVKLEKENLGLIENKIVEAFDSEHAGFGAAQKFPMPEQLEYCMLRYKTTKNEKLLDMAEKTLSASKGIFDEQEGGFYRYAVERNWSSPHYEKMLETNAFMLMNLLQAIQLGKPQFRQTAEETIDYMQKNLFNGKWFFGSQEADEEYYKLDLVKRMEGKKPDADKTLLTNHNCLAINAFLQAGVVLENKQAEAQALNALDFVLAKCADEKKGACHYWVDEARMFGLLPDNVALAECLINAFEITQRKEFLKKAEKHANWTMKTFFDGKQKALIDSVNVEEELGLLADKGAPLKENSIMAYNLVKLGMITENNDFQKNAETILNSFKGELERYGLFAAPYGKALEMALKPIKISVAGSKELFRQCLKLFEPRAVRVFEESKKESITVCIGNKCLKPVQTIAELEKQLDKQAG